VWQENARFHEQLLAYTHLAGSEGEVARGAITEFFKCTEIFWRPWLMHRGTIEGLVHYRAAQAAGRGVVTVFPHFGMVYAHLPTMPRFGIDAWVVASPHHYEEMGEGYDARFARQGLKYIEALGPGRGIARGGGRIETEGVFEQIVELLRGGATVSIAFDVVGGMPTPFLGRTLSLSGGPARTSFESGALVAPFVVRRRGRRPVMQFAPPLDPRDYGSPEELQCAIAQVIEEWALALPEAVWQLHTQRGGPPLIRGPAR
jgi:lauroyl/myristoyl acyltransferase